MTNENFTIELRKPDEAFRARVAPRPAVPSALPRRRSIPSEWVCSLAPSTPSHHDDRRMEDWIASHLDLGELSTARNRAARGLRSSTTCPA